MQNKRAKKQKTKRQKQQSPMRQRAVKFLIYTYICLTVAAIGGLIFVMQMPAEKKPAETTVPVFEEHFVEGNEPVDDDIVAILEDMGSKTIVPLPEIEKIIPLTEEPAWQTHAVTFSAKNDVPRIVIIIDDLGLNEDASNQLSRMKGPYTLAYLPYADHLPEQTARVSRAGHELMVHMPMEPGSPEVDPGTNALLSSLSKQEFSRRLEWNLSRFDGFVGINNHMGSKLTQQPGLMVDVMTVLKTNGFLFVDSLTSPKSVAFRAAEAAGVPYAARDIFLDNLRSERAILAQLEKTEKVARMRGYAIAIGHPYQITINTLKKWEKTVSDRGYQLVPLTSVIATLEEKRSGLADASGRWAED